MNEGYEKRKQDYSNKKYFEKQSQVFLELVPLNIQDQCLNIGATTASSYKLLQRFSNLFPTSIQFKYENEKVREIKFTRNWKYAISHCRCINSKSFIDNIRRNGKSFNLFPRHCKEFYCYTLYKKSRKRTKKINSKYLIHLPNLEKKKFNSYKMKKTILSFKEKNKQKATHLNIESTKTAQVNDLSNIQLHQNNSDSINILQDPEILNHKKNFIKALVFLLQDLKNQNYD
ncbi:hypothetical protein M0812_02306 [Anaeramoeba flamelloides]|uniref:Uncharacterized protein n=1 Tax=Anaeramoeba flamelloides TaxID=1746091 RepID=A0AAV7Z4W9_9EUKA|nr:hypothetical protein M0812_02306 [Anaeramoeba flamelloides]